MLDDNANITNGLYDSALHESGKVLNKEKGLYFYYDPCNILKDNTLYVLLSFQTAQAVLHEAEGAIKPFLKLRRNNANAAYTRYHKESQHIVSINKSGLFPGPNEYGSDTQNTVPTTKTSKIKINRKLYYDWLA